MKKIIILLNLIPVMLVSLHSEITISLPVNEINTSGSVRANKNKVYITGIHKLTTEPEFHLVEAAVYSRGKELKDVNRHSAKTIDEVKQVVSKVGAIQYIQYDTISLTDKELAASELKELELISRFTLKSQSLTSVENALDLLVSIEGIIIEKIYSISEIDRDDYRIALKAAISDLKTNKDLLEGSFGIRLELVGFSSSKQSDGSRQSNVLNVLSAEDFSKFASSEVSNAIFSRSSGISKRKWSDRETEATLVKEVFKNDLIVSITGEYEIARPSTERSNQAGDDNSE